MPIHLLQPTLNGGEAAPGMWHRVDYAKFSTWLRESVNFYVHPQGGVSNRPGTIMLAKTKYPAQKSRLLPFVFSKTQAYAVEVGDKYMRFFNSDGQVLDEKNLVYEVATDLEETELKDLYYCQSADVMYIARNGKRPKQLERYGHTDWKFADYVFLYGPMKQANKDESLKISVFYSNNEAKLYLSCKDNLFKAGDVGAWWKIKHRLQATNFSSEYTQQANTLSEKMLLSGEISVQTTGTWGGKVEIQYSADPSDENSWQTLHTISSIMYHDTDANQDVNSFNANDDISIPAGLWWVRICPGINNGRCYFRLDCEEQEVDVYYKITEYISPLKVAAELINDTKNLESYFAAGREYKSCIETMTGPTASHGTFFSLQADGWKILDGNRDTFARVPADGYLAFSYEFASPVIVTSISILGFGTDKPFNAGTANDDSQNLTYNGATPFIIRNEERGENVSWINEYGDILSNTVRKIEVVPTVIDKISFSVNCGRVDYKSVVEFVVRGYDYVAGQEITINATAQWSEGAWSEKNGWPSCVAQHGGRLTWGQMDSIQGTQVGDNNSFAVSSPLLDSDGFSVTLRDDGINEITALVSLKNLLAFTAGGMFASESTVITPTEAGMSKQSANGGTLARPVIIGARVLYTMPLGTKVLDGAYDYATDGIDGMNLCYIAQHLFENDRVLEMAYQREPDGLLWVLMESGKLLCLTYVHSEQVCAWTQMETAGKVESICTIPGLAQDELFLIVNRSGARYVEKMAPRLASKDPVEQFFVDCGRTYRGEPISVISGLEYLNGQEVAILADGQVEPRKTVNNGQITLTAPASVVHVGLPYTARLRTLSGDMNTDGGSIMPKKKRYVGALVSFINSRGAQVGCKEDRLETWLPEKPLAYNEAKELISIDKRFTFSGNYEGMPSLIIQQVSPLPLTVTAIVPAVQVGNL